jgi:hypothetical protein
MLTGPIFRSLVDKYARVLDQVVDEPFKAVCSLGPIPFFCEPILSGHGDASQLTVAGRDGWVAYGSNGIFSRVPMPCQELLQANLKPSSPDKYVRSKIPSRIPVSSLRKSGRPKFVLDFSSVRGSTAAPTLSSTMFCAVSMSILCVKYV